MPDFAIAYRVTWERAQRQALCQAGIVCIALGGDEFVGFCAGYLGEGEFVNEPFHIRFRGEEAIHLVIGDRSVLTNKEVLFETWPRAVRQQVAHARRQLMAVLERDEENLLQASKSEAQRITWSEAQPDEGASGAGEIDERVWLRVTKRMGLSG